MTGFPLPVPQHVPGEEELRGEVRSFLAEELRERPASLRALSWNGFDASFSRKLGARGWLGMTWPKRYGGQERSALERFVVIEEMLAAGAPVAAHWIADRQSGPLILKFGSEEQKQTVLPRIAAGECYVCIGMSEPNSGSDLASAATRARPVDGGFVINGTKLWTTYAHRAHYMILFCRTGEEPAKDGGASQLLIDLATPGIRISPIHDLAGEHHFNEVSFSDVFVPQTALIGEMGQGWRQVMSELAFERSGPERFLSSYTLLSELVAARARAPGSAGDERLGRLLAQTIVLRHLSRCVATMLDRGENPELQAAVVKNLGALLEQEIPEVARRLVDVEPSMASSDAFAAVLAYTTMTAPMFSLRGGTREILRGIIARGLQIR